MKSSGAERAVEPRRRSASRRTGLPATVTSARTWPSPGVSISSASVTTGSSPKTSGRPRTRLCQRPKRTPAPVPGVPDACSRCPPAGVVNIAPPSRSRLPVEHVDDVDEPARERAELLRARADAAVAPRPRGASRARARSAGSSPASIPQCAATRSGVKSRGERARPRRARRSAPRPAPRSDEALGEERVHDRRTGSARRCRADRQVLVRLVRGLERRGSTTTTLAAARADRRGGARACRARSSGCRSTRTGSRRASTR